MSGRWKKLLSNSMVANCSRCPEVVGTHARGEEEETGGMEEAFKWTIRYNTAAYAVWMSRDGR